MVCLENALDGQNMETQSSPMDAFVQECLTPLERRPRFRRWRGNSRSDFWGTTAHMSGEEFTRAFRMGRPLFQELLQRLDDRISVTYRTSRDMNSGCSGRSRRSFRITVSPAVRLACALRMLYGAACIDLNMMFAISRPTLYRILFQVCRAIFAELSRSGIPIDDVSAL